MENPLQTGKLPRKEPHEEPLHTNGSTATVQPAIGNEG